MLPDDLLKPGSKSPISFPKLLVVEGTDQGYLVKALLKHLGLLETIEIRNFGGVGDLPKYLTTLPAIEGFRNVVSLGILRDAELNAQSAFDAVCSAIETARSSPAASTLHPRLCAPKEPMKKTTGELSVSVFVLPDCKSAGMLEDLCLKSVHEDAAMHCVDRYFECLRERTLPLPGNMAKARIHTFLSSRKKPNLLIGQAAQKGYFPWDSSAFDLLKEFIKAL